MPVLDLSTRRFLLPPMHREGRRFVWIAGVCTLLATLAWPPLFFAGLLLTYGVFLFFRDPERVTPDAPQTVFSPADGIVCLLMQVPIPAVLEAGAHPVWRSACSCVLDVHVNRMPTAGTIVKCNTCPEPSFNASLERP
jgi:phosphatidylserine decarboxylase